MKAKFLNSKRLQLEPENDAERILLEESWSDHGKSVYCDSVTMGCGGFMNCTLSLSNKES